MDAAFNWAGLLPYGLALVWLTPLAGYDIRRREVPHIAWVGIPALLMAVVALMRGDWPLATLTGITMLASEAPRLGKGVQRAAWILAAISVPFLIMATRPEALAGALFIVGSWIMFELSWWAGADALAAMALALLWPNMTLLVCVALGHGLWGVIWRWLRPRTDRAKPARGRSLRKLTPEELSAVGAPGLPSLALATAGYLAVALITGSV